jgi:hypothetical protein
MRATSSLSPSTAALWKQSIIARSTRPTPHGRASHTRPTSRARREAAAEIASSSSSTLRIASTRSASCSKRVAIERERSTHAAERTRERAQLHDADRAH